MVINKSFIIIDTNDIFKINKIDSILESLSWDTTFISKVGTDDHCIIATSDKDMYEIRLDMSRVFETGVTSLFFGINDEIYKQYNNGYKDSFKICDFDSIYESYIINNQPMSLSKSTDYTYPTNSSDLKAGMVVEYFNSGKWVKRSISNPTEEWSKMYSLLSKYKRVRVEV